MASIILKNNSFGGPTHFDRRVATFESKPRVTRERHLAEKQQRTRCTCIFAHGNSNFKSQFLGGPPSVRVP